MDSARKRDPLLPWLIIPAFNTFEFLHESDGGVTRFCEGELFYHESLVYKNFPGMSSGGLAYVLGIFLGLH